MGRSATKNIGIAFGCIVVLSVLTGCAGMSIPGVSGQEAASLQPAQFTFPPFDGLKKRLAVIKFENKVKTPIPDESWKIGEGLTEMLTSELFKTDRFIMVERAALADIVKEQELGQTGLVRSGTAAKVGELLGAQLLVAGAVTEFESQSSGGGGGVGYAGFSLKLQMSNAHVGIDIRLVDSSTGQILKSHNASGTAKTTSIGFGATVEGVQFGSDAFQKTPLGEATREAIFKAVLFIIAEMDVLPWTGRVVQIKGKDVYVNAGSNVNLKPGLILAASTKGEDLIDPATGLSLGSQDARVGTVVLRDIQERFSIGAFSGHGALKRGDLVRFDAAPVVPPASPVTMGVVPVDRDPGAIQQAPRNEGR
jgi:curli biogenesis system outer membrane secretion channel CsgG